MHKLISAASLLVAGVLVCGCGGGGGGGSKTIPNPLAGAFGGDGTASNTSDRLSADIGIGVNGLLCGSIKDSTAKTKTLIGAMVSNTGAVSHGSVQVLDSHGSAVGTAALSGQITAGPIGKYGPISQGVVLTAAEGNTTVTYNFSSLQNLRAALVRARKLRRRKKI